LDQQSLAATCNDRKTFVQILCGMRFCSAWPQCGCGNSIEFEFVDYSMESSPTAKDWCLFLDLYAPLFLCRSLIVMYRHRQLL
jgi:hypothetical protein